MKVRGAKSHTGCPCSITSCSYGLTLLQKIIKMGVDIRLILKAGVVHSMASCVADEFENDPGDAPNELCCCEIESVFVHNPVTL